MALPTKKTTTVPPVEEGLDFLSLSFYSAGGGIPPGDYLWKDVAVMMHEGFGAEKKGPSRLGVMITMVDLHDPTSDERKQFYSFGTKADKSLAPNPAHGKGIVPIPGAPAFNPPDSTNWVVLLKSLLDCDESIVQLPKNNLSWMDGLWVRMDNIPEPESRKSFASTAQTGEVQEQRKNQTIAVVQQILEGGKPWEGGGGIPQKGATPKAGKAVAPKAPAASAPPPPPPEASSEDEDVKVSAINGISEVLSTKPDGCLKMLLRTQAFGAIKKAVSQDMASAVISTYFASDETLNAILAEVGYRVDGLNIKVAA